MSEHKAMLLSTPPMMRHEDLDQCLKGLKLTPGQECAWHQTLYVILTTNGIFIPP